LWQLQLLLANGCWLINATAASSNIIQQPAAVGSSD
jgi:hypothetical protein